MDAAIQFVLSCASAGFSAIIAYFGWWLKKRDREREAKEDIRQKEYDAIRSGMRAILRDRIIQLYEDCAARGQTPFYAVENITTMYNAYHDLGGNGAITEIYHKFIHLPQKSKGKEAM